MMLDLEAYEEAVGAFAEVPEDAERRYLERALYGQGKAAYLMGSHDTAITALQELLEKYPLSALVFDAQ
ncbi:MAG: tetratricopeptide repeat protein, partial [Desulfuromonadales bacterium]|nr:tetratricopeptide repeat protein [Desulfuromonadales bacterium]